MFLEGLSEITEPAFPNIQNDFRTPHPLGDLMIIIIIIIVIIITIIVGRDSSVGIATRYGLEGPGIESR